MFCVTDRAGNVQLIESRPDLPRQNYDHSTMAKTSRNKSSSVELTKMQLANQYLAGSSSVSGNRPPPPAGRSSSTKFSETSSGTSVSGRVIPSYRNTAKSSSSLSGAASCSNQPLQVDDGQSM